TTREGDLVRFERAVEPGQNIVPRGSEATAGQTILKPGIRLGYAELALAAQVGAVQLQCAQRPRVAILSTGDEVVLIDETPGPFQIRNSNSVSLAAQVRIAGGEPIVLGNAADRIDDLGEKIEHGLKEDALVLSGGVSMGKYDLVESVLKAMGAEFFFDAVAIRPGKPAVFGMCQGKPVFGLPGNPVSTMVTFELFVAPAIDLLSGAQARALPLVEARLAEALKEKPGLAHFLPAHVGWGGGVPEVKAVTTRTAAARGFVKMKPRVVSAVRRVKNPKGNPLEVARIAGIAAAKRTAEWIPLCHPLPLTHIDVTARLCQNGVEVRSTVTTAAQTGVEMEALVAVTAAALTVYDMCKALDKGMEITDIVLTEKTGGKSGDFRRGKAAE